MTVTLPRYRRAGAGTRVYEFFDPGTLEHLWFIAAFDLDSVQMLAPTFRSERAASVFEYCYRNHPGGYLLSIDSQLELGRRIEERLSVDTLSGEAALGSLCEGLAFEHPQPGRRITRLPAYADAALRPSAG